MHQTKSVFQVNISPDTGTCYAVCEGDSIRSKLHWLLRFRLDLGEMIIFRTPYAYVIEQFGFPPNFLL